MAAKNPGLSSYMWLELPPIIAAQEHFAEVVLWPRVYVQVVPGHMQSNSAVSWEGDIQSELRPIASFTCQSSTAMYLDRDKCMLM